MLFYIKYNTEEFIALRYDGYRFMRGDAITVITDTLNRMAPDDSCRYCGEYYSKSELTEVLNQAIVRSVTNA